MEKKKNNTVKIISSVAAVLVLILAGIFIGKGLAPSPAADIDTPLDETLAAVISLDVNPSVELKVNNGEKVISATGINEDGKRILGDMELRGSDLEVAVNAVIGSMLRHGYLDEMANSILVSVAGSEGFDADALEAKLSSEIDAILTNGAVLSQNVSEVDDEVRAISEKYGISVGKAALIEEIVDSTENHNARELSSLSINELNLISSSGLENVRSEGKASDKAYIGRSAALKIALELAGVSEADATEIEAELDHEHGCMVYEIEFCCGGIEYEYDVNAVTGEVIYATVQDGNEAHSRVVTESIPTEGGQQSPSYVSGSALTKDEAVALALAKAGLSSSDITGLEVELDRDGGKIVYEIEFRANGYEYSCEVDSLSGKVYDFKRERDDDADLKPTEKPVSDEIISKSEAKSIALNKAGLSAGDVGKMFVELERDDGRPVYEIEFVCKGYEYSVELDARNGSILDYEKEADD